MELFTKNETEKIAEGLLGAQGSILVTFRNKHGPTKLLELWTGLLSRLGFGGKCLNWWSSSGTLGLIECDIDSRVTIYGQWALADKNELIGVFEVDNDDVVNIREGFDAGNVVASEMRAIRIGETGDRD
jgi:limonene-1,2-epoxide hydrolase